MRDLLVGGGLFVLGVVSALVVEAITGKAYGVIVRRWFLFRAARRRRLMARTDDLVERGSECLYVHQFVPGGYEPRNLRLLLRREEAIESRLKRASPELLPLPADELVAAIADKREELGSASSWQWNGPGVAVENIDWLQRDLRDEQPILNLNVSLSDHAAAQVCSETWQDWYDAADRRSVVFGSDEAFRGIPGMLNAIGLNATIVTDDEQLVLVRRNPRMTTGRSGFHISVNEGMLPTDRETGEHLDPYRGLVRGIEEELGLADDTGEIYRALVFHTSMLDMRRYQFGLLGHVDLKGTRITAETLRTSRLAGIPRDKMENTEVLFIDWKPQAILRFLSEPDWIAHGWLNLLLSAIQEFPSQASQFRALLGPDTRPRWRHRPTPGNG